jgi:hypothetical protein
MLARLQQFRNRSEIAAGLNQLDIAENQIAVDEFVERRLLSGILAVPESLFFAGDVPRDLFIPERPAVSAVDE